MRIPTYIHTEVSKVKPGKDFFCPLLKAAKMDRRFHNLKSPHKAHCYIDNLHVLGPGLPSVFALLYADTVESVEQEGLHVGDFS